MLSKQGSQLDAEGRTTDGDGKAQNRVAVAETVILLNDERYWLLAAVDPATNDILGVRLHSACTTAPTERLLRELRQKNDVDDVLLLVDSAPWLHAALYHYDS